MILHTALGLIWQLLNPMKKTFFLKLFFREIQKFPYEILTFFRTRYTNFLLHTLITLMILHTEFGLIWTTPWPDEKELFSKFSKFAIREICNIPYENAIFSWTSYTKNTFSFTLSLHWLYSIPSLVWLAQLLTRWKRNFFKIRKNSLFEKFAKFRMRTQLFS